MSSRSKNTKTWILMLGIAAVVALDLGFTVLVGSEDTLPLALDTPARMPKSAEPPRPAPEQIQPEVADVPDAEEPQSPVTRPARIHIAKSVASRGSVRTEMVALTPKQVRPIYQSQPKQSMPAAVRPQFASAKPLGFGPYVVTTSENIGYANAEVRRNRNRSLASKFSPLVQKPWHLMKSLVSKLR